MACISRYKYGSQNGAAVTNLDTLVVQLQAILDTAREDIADLRAVSALLAAALHPALLVHNAALDDAIADRLADDVLRILLRVEVQLHADVAERNARVREREPPDARLDDVLAQAHDHSVGPVLLEHRRILRKGRLKLGQRAHAHG